MTTLTAEQLRALHVRTTSDVVRRAIKRRLQQLEHEPAPALPVFAKAPMHEPGFAARVLANRPPTTRQWWSLAQIAETLDRTVEQERKKGK